MTASNMVKMLILLFVAMAAKGFMWNEDNKKKRIKYIIDMVMNEKL
jgi:hypothetical protein